MHYTAHDALIHLPVRTVLLYKSSRFLRNYHMWIERPNIFDEFDALIGKWEKKSFDLCINPVTLRLLLYWKPREEFPFCTSVFHSDRRAFSMILANHDRDGHDISTGELPQGTND